MVKWDEGFLMRSAYPDDGFSKCCRDRGAWNLMYAMLYLAAHAEYTGERIPERDQPLLGCIGLDDNHVSVFEFDIHLWIASNDVKIDRIGVHFTV